MPRGKPDEAPKKPAKPKKAPSPFAVKVKALREQQGLTQASLAEKAGMHPMALAKIEQGNRGGSPSWDTVQVLAKALGVTCEHFQTEPAPIARKARAKK